MSKKRRTKKEKLAAGARHDFSAVFTLSNQEVKMEIQTPVPQQTTVTQYVSARQNASYYSYVAKDIRNTLTITTALIAVNVLLYFILKLKFLSIPGIGF